MPSAIPKRAFFCWGGGEMPWMSRMAIESFKSLHPNWRVDVVLIDGDDRPSAVKASDLMRYKELSEFGGCYFDTDIIFTRHIGPLLQNDADTFVCFESAGKKYVKFSPGGDPVMLPEWFSIASLFSCPGNDFFAEIRRSALEPGRFETHEQQLYGVTAFSGRFETLSDAEAAFPHRKFFNIPRKAFLPVDWRDVKSLYRKDDGLYERLVSDPDVYGIHWYGGDRTGRIADSWTEQNYWHDTPLGMAAASVIRVTA